MSDARSEARTEAVQHIRRRLQRQATPRQHMLAIVAATAACGLLASFLLLKVGITAMALRYPMAVAIAYLAFLLLVRVWLQRFRLRERGRGTEPGSLLDVDIVEIPLGRMWESGTPDAGIFGGGGGFSGGGASRTWGGGQLSQQARAALASPTTSSSTSAGGSWDLDLDEGAVWLIPAAIVALIAFSVVIYVVIIAPTFFAELLLDAGLAAGLYRRLARMPRRSWLVTAVRNTVVPAAFVAGLLAIAGAVMQSVYPDAVSVGRVAGHVMHRANR